MNDPRDLPILVIILSVGSLLILAALTVAAYYTIGRDEREAKRQAQANVREWWISGSDFGLVDSRPHALMSDDDAGDGDDEGLVRVPPDVLLRRTLTTEVDGAA